MSVAFLTALSLSLTGSVLALILLALKPALRFRFSKGWQYYIWLVVLARLLLPFSPEVNLINVLAEGMPAPQISVQTPASGTEPDGNDELAVPNTVLDIVPGDSHTLAAEPADRPTPSTTTPVPWYSVLEYTGYLWAAVALVLLVRKVVSYVGLVREIRKSSTLCGDSDTVSLMDTLCQSMRISPAPALYVSDAVPSPMLIGLLRQQVILPADATGQADLKFVLQHELVHYKRLDILYKWLSQIAVCVHWFNPLVYLVRREISRNCELACDEAVIRRVAEQERKDYGEAILSAIKPGKALAHSGVSVSMSEDTQVIKERLDAIMKYSKKSKLAVLLSVLVAGFMMCGAAFAGVYTAEAASAASSATNGAEPSIIAPTSPTDKSHTDDGLQYSPYLAFGISVDTSGSRDVLYYNGVRVRLLVDYKENNAFHLFFADKDGATDLLVVRNAQGVITGISDMPSTQAQEFINELDMVGIATTPSTDSAGSAQVTAGRISKEDLPPTLQGWISEVDQGDAGIFAALYEDRFFIYCNSIQGQFAWQPSYGATTTISLHDMSATGDGYALLNIPRCDVLTVTYGSATATFTPETATPVTSADRSVASDTTALYNIYDQYGLVYQAAQDKLYYNGQTVRYFVDRYNNGQGIRAMWACDMDGVVDVYAVRNSTGEQGQLVGVALFSDEDFRLRTLEIEAQQNNDPNFDVLTFKFSKSEAPDHLLLWIEQCEESPLDFQVTGQGGRYYVYVRGDGGFGFSGNVSDGNASMNMEIYSIDGLQGDGYALYSVPLYTRFVVSYNGQSKSYVK